MALLVAGCSATQATDTTSGPFASRPTPVLESKPTMAPVKGVDRRPNIVLVTTDDQATTDMQWMPRTRRLLGDAGVTFTNALSPHPLCCPARAEILTGQYTQNNGVRHNKGPYGGYQAFDGSRTLATWLNAARYQTAFIGKYLNSYAAVDTAEPGWDIWNPISKAVYRYYGFEMFNNGQPRRYFGVHTSDLLGQRTVDNIERFSRNPQPFFIWASHVAPHSACVPRHQPTCWAPPVPADRYESLFPEAESPTLRNPAFNEADVSDKPPTTRSQRIRDPERLNENFRRRIRSLQGVDEAVADAVRALRRTGELGNTVFAFASDNGYLMGLHRHLTKDLPYEQALSVPLLVRGPGFPAGETRAQVVTLLDLAPTFLDMADARATIPVDGRSLLPLAEDPARPGYDTVLIQGGPRDAAQEEAGWRYRGVRTDRYTYARYPSAGFTELYDRKVDPHQLTNISGDPAYRRIEQILDRRTTILGHCSGAGCRQSFPPLPLPGHPAATPR